jgi:glycosyltransferase involved in cell wall biosynthesis
MKQNRIICQMIVHNEADRYLRQVLEGACKWADSIIIVDDYSTDNTVEICKQFGTKVQISQLSYGRSMFSEDESKLREGLWELVRKEAQEGDWIVSLDADEEFSYNFSDWLHKFINDDPKYNCVTFKLCDMWTSTQYRVDGLWSPLITRAFKYENKPVGLTGTIHCGCIPSYVWATKQEYTYTSVKLKHLGWIRDEDKDRKHDFYIKKATGINLLHAQSIKHIPLLHTYTEELPEVLIATLIRNRAWCLPKFLEALERQTHTYPANKISYIFIVNDSVDESEELLKKWAQNEGKKYKEIKIRSLNFGNSDALDHTWSDVKLKNMADMRDMCLELLKTSTCTFLFSIDSDVILQHDDILRHLVGLDKAVVSEVFWAKWEQNTKRFLPNVWLSGGYNINEGFIKQLCIPGLYEVGGLGAVTLIHRDVVEHGVNYQRVVNLPQDMRGEDRDFCTRATVAGFKLWADTYKTPLHLERSEEEKLAHNKFIQSKSIDQFKEKIINPVKEELPVFKVTDNTVSLCMIVKNEERNMRGALSSVKPFVNEMIVVDTGSTDKTKELAKEFTEKVYEFEWCDDYAAARNFALSKATSKWILFLDGDELVPPETLKHFYDLIQKPELTAVLVPVKNVHIPTKENPGNFHYSETYRLFRNSPKIKFTGCVHEDISDSLEQLGKVEQVGVVRAMQFITNLGFLIKPVELQSKHDYYGKLLLKEIQRNPTNFKPYYEYAVFLLDRGEFDEAETYYNKSLALNPSFWMSNNDKAVLRLKRAINDQLIIEAAGFLDLALIAASKRASQHQIQVIQTNANIVRQLMKYFKIEVPQDNNSKIIAEMDQKDKETSIKAIA